MQNPHSATSSYTMMSKSEREFRAKLQGLYVMYGQKFNQRKDVQLPESLRDQIGDTVERTDIRELEFDQCVDLFLKIRELQEKLGHTALESEVYEEQGFGSGEEGEIS